MVRYNKGDSEWLEKFIASSAQDEAEILDPRVVIENLDTEPYTARAEFVRVFKGQAGNETKRERWDVKFVFSADPNSVSGDKIEHNPIGMAIQSFHADTYSGGTDK